MLRESRLIRSAVLLADFLAGNPPDAIRHVRLLRQLNARIKTWLAAKPEEALRWQPVLGSAAEACPDLAELLQDVCRSDAIARRLIDELVAPEVSPPVPVYEYQDFVVAIEGNERGSLTARLLDVPYGGRAAVELDLSFDIQEQVEALDATLRNPDLSRILKPRMFEKPVPAPSELATLLSKTFFVGGIGSAWTAAMGLLAGRPDLGIRLKLIFDLECPRVGPVAALPWELLLDPATGHPLCKNIRKPVVRSIETLGSRLPIGLQRTRQVLLVHSQPKESQPLDLRTESLLIREAWQAVSGVQVETLAGDLGRLRERLRSKSFQVLHLMGHGDFDRATQKSHVIFESPQGQAAPISAEMLAGQLLGIPLDLIVLSLCHGATLPRTEGVTPFASIAAQLLRAGFPAVLAMQFPISDGAAIEFSHTLYRCLVAGHTVESAVAEGRLAILRANPDSWEWLTPVLYQQGGLRRLRS